MKVNILVVDDRPEGLVSIEAVLKSPTYNLVFANSGKEALKCLLHSDFAVILLDVQMPEMNGFETAELIRTRDKSRHIPIIFMSAISQEERFVHQGYEAGAVDYIMKPFDPYILRSKVSIFVDLYLKNRTIMEQSRLLHENEIQSYTRALDRLELEGLRKYQYLADAIPQIVFRFLPDGSHEYFNKVWFEYTGYSLEHSQGTGWRDAIHPDDLASFLDLPSGEIDIECRIKSKTGAYRWHLVRIRPERYHELEQISAWLGTATDIEERKQEEQQQQFLGLADQLLMSGLDFRETFSKVVKLAAQEICDFCSVMVLDEQGESTVLSSEAGPPPEDALHIGAPLKIHGSIKGQLSFFYRSENETRSQRQQKVVRELALRMALALENAELYSLSQKAIELRNEFLSIASHELNTPVTSLKLQLQIVQRNLKDFQVQKLERFEKSIGTSLRQVDRLIDLIRVLLDISHIQSGQFSLSYTESTIYEVVEEVVDRHKEIITSSGSELHVEEVPDMLMYWDRVRIEQVLTNLLINAVKYAPGRIELRVSKVQENLEIEVKDYGEGIEKEKLEGIFERFSRANSQSVAGMGLGLYIVKQIVEGHGGSIQVKSSAQGSSFKVLLPMSVKANSAGAETQEEEQVVC